MEVNTGTLAKGFATFDPFISPFSSVNYLMLNEDRLLPKRFPTLATLIGLFSRVNTAVLNKAGAPTRISHIHHTYKSFLRCEFFGV